MNLTTENTPLQPSPAFFFDPDTRLFVVANTILRPQGQTIDDIARQFDVGRTFLYEQRKKAKEALLPRRPGPDTQKIELRNLRQKVGHLEAENERTIRELAAANEQLARSVEVTDERVIRTALEALTSPTATRPVHQILVEAFGEDCAPADNTLSRMIKRYGGLAGRIMNKPEIREKYRILAPDEIFFHKRPVLGACDPESTAIAALEMSDDCNGESWEVLFSYFPHLEYIVSDLGKGILGGSRRSSVVSQSDMLHVLWLFPKVEKKLDKKAEEAMWWWDHYLDYVTDPHCPGRKPLGKLAKAEARATVAFHDLEALLEAKELIIQAMSPFTKDHRLSTRRSQVKLVRQAIKRLGRIRARNVGAIKLQRTLAIHKNRFVNFTRELWNIDVQVRDVSIWSEKSVIAALGRHLGLCKALTRSHDPDEKRRLYKLLSHANAMRLEALDQCKNGVEVETKLWQRVSYLLRSSSLEEMINGKLRPVQAIKKRVNQAFLCLWALKQNLSRYEQGKRAGRTPYEILGVRLEGDHDGWLGVLLAEARKEGLLR